MMGSSPTRAELLRLLRRVDGCTIRDLIQATGLSPSALRQQLTLLERDGLIHKTLVRGRLGRPPVLHRIGPGDAAAPRSYAALLPALLHALSVRNPRELQRTAERAAARIAAEHREIVRIADIEDRIRAALGVLFDTASPAHLTRGGQVYEVTVPVCAVAPLAAEFPILCEIARRLLASLAGAQVDQRKSILRGDPHCVFVLTVPEHRSSPVPRNAANQGDGGAYGRRPLA